MSEKIRNIPFLHKRRLIVLSIVIVVLFVPLIAMQFSNEVDWKPFDFLVAGVLLSGTGLLCELVLRKVKKTSVRIAICAAILLVLFLIWVELAVGLFGTPFAGS